MLPGPAAIVPAPHHLVRLGRRDAGATGAVHFLIMTSLADKNCVPCKGGMPALHGAALHELSHQLPNWKVVDEHHIVRAFKFPDFREALDFVNRVGEVAEDQGHHPDVCLGWGKAEVTLWTHAANGLTENDFIMAARIDGLEPFNR